MLAADLEMGGPLGSIGFDLDETIDTISDVIIKWNTQFQYDQRKGNCQQFVDDMCNALGINLNFDGPLGEYLQLLRERGECELAFPISDDMREQLEIQEKKKHFNTHEELDEFVKMLVDKDPQFEENYAQDWLLLKVSTSTAQYWLAHTSCLSPTSRDNLSLSVL